MGELRTGIRSLDGRLSGGLTAGSVLATVTSPASQSEALIHQLMRRRPTPEATATDATLFGPVAVGRP